MIFVPNDGMIEGKGISSILNFTCRRSNPMKYGYFDDAAREYVITRPDTPYPLSLIHISFTVMPRELAMERRVSPASMV